MPKSKMTQPDDQTFAFKGLSEKELIELSSRAKIDKLQAGEFYLKKALSSKWFLSFWMER
jgi:hypothetical protein